MLGLGFGRVQAFLRASGFWAEVLGWLRLKQRLRWAKSSHAPAITCNAWNLGPPEASRKALDSVGRGCQVLWFVRS